MSRCPTDRHRFYPSTAAPRGATKVSEAYERWQDCAPGVWRTHEGSLEREPRSSQPPRRKSLRSTWAALDHRVGSSRTPVPPEIARGFVANSKRQLRPLRGTSTQGLDGNNALCKFSDIVCATQVATAGVLPCGPKSPRQALKKRRTGTAWLALQGEGGSRPQHTGDKHNRVHHEGARGGQVCTILWILLCIPQIERRKRVPFLVRQ